MSFELGVFLIMVLVPVITSVIIFGIPKLIKFLREQD